MQYTSMMVNSKRFTFRKKQNELVAFVSDLGPDFRFVPIYQDSCDLGFTMLSERTGKVVNFVVVCKDKDHDGTVNFWELDPTMGSYRAVPECRGIKVFIYND